MQKTTNIRDLIENGVIFNPERIELKDVRNRYVSYVKSNGIGKKSDLSKREKNLIRKSIYKGKSI